MKNVLHLLLLLTTTVWLAIETYIITRNGKISEELNSKDVVYKPRRNALVLNIRYMGKNKVRFLLSEYGRFTRIVECSMDDLEF